MATKVFLECLLNFIKIFHPPSGYTAKKRAQSQLDVLTGRLMEPWKRAIHKISIFLSYRDHKNVGAMDENGYKNSRKERNTWQMLSFASRSPAAVGICVHRMVEALTRFLESFSFSVSPLAEFFIQLYSRKCCCAALFSPFSHLIILADGSRRPNKLVDKLRRDFKNSRNSSPSFAQSYCCFSSILSESSLPCCKRALPLFMRWASNDFIDIPSKVLMTREFNFTMNVMGIVQDASRWVSSTGRRKSAGFIKNTRKY